MDEDLQTDNFQQNHKRFRFILEEVTRIKDDFVVRQFRWYEVHTRRPAVFFRATGVLIILLSVSLPFLTTLEGPWKTIALPVISLSIAGFTGLNSFFRWESDWRGYRQAQLALEYLLITWEL